MNSLIKKEDQNTKNKKLNKQTTKKDNDDNNKKILFTKKRKRTSVKELQNETRICVFCNKKIKGRNEIVQHYVTHAKKKIKQNREEVAKNEHIGFHRCQTCLQEFVERDDFEEHQKNYHKSYPYLCGICNKCVKRPQQYLEHMNSHQNGPIKCPDCDFTTSFTLALKIHRKCHPNFEDPFMCKECGATFSVLKEMNAHKREKHPKDPSTKPEYECTICQKIYYRIKRLKTHMKTHSGDTNKSCICDTCGKIISCKKNLELHKRIHTGYKPYSCSYCEKQFTSGTTLRDHVRVHSGEKPFACEHCGKCFSQRTPLTIHLRLHTGERPYVCPICSKGFVSKGSMDLHMKNGKH